MNSEELYKIFQERVSKGEVIDWLSGQKECFSCHKNIYEYLNEEDVTEYSITGCPVCHRSFVD